MTRVLDRGRVRPQRPSGRRRPMPFSVVAVLAVLGAAACSPTAPGAASSAATAAPSTSVASTSPAAPSVEASTAASQSAAAAASGPCVDVADLADLGEPVVTAMTGIPPALAAGKVDDARKLVETATKGMASMAEQVAPASPEAKELFTTAAADLTTAASQFPSGGSIVDKARDELDQAFALASKVKCAS